MKIGEYVRTINGKIWVIKSQKAISGHKKDIIKSSPNIIDLIEPGDYVNGFYIEKNNGRYLETSEISYTNSYLGHTENIRIYDFEIKTIVTKEQFEGVEYKIWN